MSMIQFEERAYSQLGFDDVQALIADYARSESVRQSILDLKPFNDRVDLAGRLEQLSRLQQYDPDANSLSIQEYPDLDVHLNLLKLKDSTLSATGLVAIKDVLRMTRECAEFLGRRIEPDDPYWLPMVESITPLPHLENEVSRIIGPDLEVLDSASPELNRLRKQIRRSSGSVRSRMQSLVKQYQSEGWLNEENATLKGGRLVLPVVSSYKHQVKGVIQDQSNTGATTFIEPYEIIELNNQIKSLQIEAQREVERILKALSGTLHPDTDRIQRNFAALKVLDYFQALNQFGQRFKAVVPILSKDSHLHLKNARNPRLMLQREVVPLDLELSPAEHTLIITGPNAGGKTVALKTIGLLAIMANCGLPIPAESGSRVPWFDHIFTDIGDQQSLVNDLSTFSAHMHAIVQIQSAATDESLVLLDELGTGTDPAEGGSLARALLETLGNRGVKTIATTHLGELKVYAHDTDGVVNAAMEFDQAALEPTYRFQAGIPGSSYGFEISKRLGLPASILDAAKSYLGSTRTRLEDLLRNLESERQETRSLHTTVEALQKELTRKQTQIDRGLAKVKKAEKHAERDAARQAQQIVADGRKTIERLVREIRESQARPETIKAVQEELTQLELKVDNLASEPEAAIEVEPLSADGIVPDLRVTLIPLAQQGVVVGEPSGGKVYVDVDGKRMKVPLEWLGQAAQPAGDSDSGEVVVNVQRTHSASFTLDLRGDRFSEGQQRLQAFLDRAVLANLPEVQIIHGKGTGVLAKMVADQLKQHRAVAEFNLGGLDEGGAGVTFVKLK